MRHPGFGAESVNTYLCGLPSPATDIATNVPYKKPVLTLYLTSAELNNKTLESTENLVL